MTLMTTDRAAELIRTLHLQPHPEGGFYREIYRSAGTVRPGDARGVRSALTTIYFLLRAGERSRLHRVESDEAWHHYEGAPLELLWCGADFGELRRVELGGVEGERRPVEVVPSGHWQAARSLGKYTLVGCTVGPGFDFADFRMLHEGDPEAASARASQPALAVFL
jgi:predicted cupin superfamily sugar epimerase